MSRQTTNYGLTKPDYTDTADIEVVNSNMDIIDEALKVIDTKTQNVMSKNSSAWSSTTTYTVGQYCIYNNSLWKCLVQHSGQTPQEGTYWARVSLDTLGAEISAINQNLSNKADKGNVDWLYSRIQRQGASANTYRIKLGISIGSVIITNAYCNYVINYVCDNPSPGNWNINYNPFARPNFGDAQITDVQFDANTTELVVTFSETVWGGILAIVS